MPATKNKPKSPDPGNRRASDPYTIHLDNDNYILTQEILVKNVEEKLLRVRRWYYPKLKLVSFLKGKLELKCSHEESSEILTILVEKDKLHVSCSCNTEASMLCFHAYKVFDRLMWGDQTDYFQQFKPNGIYQIAHAHKTFFAIKPTDRGISISSKPGLGMIYSLESDLDIAPLSEALSIPVEDKSKPAPFPNNTALTYVIVQSSHSRLLPFLVPCIGKLNKYRNFIKGFGGFISGAQKEYDKYLNEDQRTLNKLCFNTWRIVENSTGTLLLREEGSLEQRKNIQAVYDFWQSVFPILQLQPFLHLYFLYWKKELKKRPSKSRIQPIRVSTNEPALRFRLIDKGEIYQFELRIFVENKEIKQFIDSPTFFIQNFDNDTLFLLKSLRDAAIVEWMKTLKNKVSIFKEHYKEFEVSVLNRLKKYYLVDLIEYKSK